ncbi:MAG TPA: c-type cytochrome, partial [Polyangiaceae bacterium]|nr:c-type cytochrome [Polyangiaceae bacterium]
ARMQEIDGPVDPPLTAATPEELEKKLKEARTALCQGHEKTRHCIQWLQLDPVDEEIKKLTLTIAKAERPLKDAQLWLERASAKAEPKFDIKNPIQSLVGPFQIEQIVTSWMNVTREVDLEQVDRCHTCHMGIDKAPYTAANIPPEFRTHPRRDLLMASHPIDSFGCTACHQGQGRATDELAHSRWSLETKWGKERWHLIGDHYWEDPLLPVGHMARIIVDDQNDQFDVKIGKGKKTPVKIEHGVYSDAEEHGSESAESQVFGALQSQLQTVLDQDAEAAKKWRAVVRKLDNRVNIGLEPIDPNMPRADLVKDLPRMQVSFPKFRAAQMLGFKGQRELDSNDKNPADPHFGAMFVAPAPPTMPVRVESAQVAGTWVDTESEYKYVPPNGAYGLSIPDDLRNRFIQALPEIESGCLRCHHKDADLVPRRSHAGHVSSKLRYEKAESELAKGLDVYRQKYGTDQLPSVQQAPMEMVSLAPTLDEGRTLFRQLNCTGCHLLEGYDNNNDAGPQLNDISAKVTPEWLLTWLRHPRGWRAKTSMPNLWPRPLDPASKLPYTEGSPEYEKWKKQRTEETLAIAAFLWERSENPSSRPQGAKDKKPLRDTINGYASVEGASAELGKKLFTSYGCQGCHSNVESGAELPAAWRARERDIAPTLSNLKNKTNADWIAYWVEDPSRYWHGTSMPKLRLTRAEAASIAQFLVGLEQKPPAPAEVTREEAKMISDAKLRQEKMVCEVAGGQTLSRVECGAKVIEQRGCFGCHRIDGFEKASPIGPELTGFAQKDVSTLDFGYAITDHHLQTTETFAALKLDAPRVFVRDRIELKMGDFDVSPDEIRALVIFLKGTVNSTPSEKFDPMKDEQHAAAVAGRQLMNDLNCRGCHVIEGRGADIDGWRAALLGQDPQLRAPYLDGEGARVQPEWLFTFFRDPGAHGIRPWLHPDWAFGAEIPDEKRALRMPTFNLSTEQWTSVVRYFATWDEQAYPYQVAKVQDRTRDEKLWAVKNMNSTQTGNCLSCHYFREFPVERARGDLGKMAPNMDMIRQRLRPEWVHNWLLRPHNFLPYTKMTAFFASVDRKKDGQRFPKFESGHVIYPSTESDPFISPPAVGWDAVLPGFRKLTNEEQAELLRDFVFSIPDGALWPAIGEEETSPMVDPEAALRALAEEQEKKPAAPGAPGARPGAPGR